MAEKRAYCTNKPCLIRCGPYDEYKVIHLHKKVEVVIGRNPSSDFCIASPVISRIHAVLKRDKNQWTITDQKSMNGIFINGTKLLPFEPSLLKDKMRISFGMKENESDFTYVYKNEQESETGKKHRKLQSDVDSQSQASTQGSVKSVVEEKQALETELNLVKKSLEEKNAIESALREELHFERMKNKIIAEDLEEQNKNLQEAIATIDDKNNVTEEYSKFISQLQKNVEAITADIAKIEERLKNTPSARSNCQEILIEKQRLQTSLATKLLKQKLLQEKMNTLSLKEESEKNKHCNASVVTEIMEMELQCSICSELFIEATTLNCSHSFCKKCIKDWVRKCGKNATCPICRRPVRTQTRSSVLDSFIDKILETVSVETKEKRLELVKQRQESKEKRRNPPKNKYRRITDCYPASSTARGRSISNPIEIVDSD